MLWLSNSANAVDSYASRHLAPDVHAPAPRMSKVIAARQAVIHQNYNENQMLDQIVNALASDAMGS